MSSCIYLAGGAELDMLSLMRRVGYTEINVLSWIYRVQHGELVIII
jgi:hypothetical protein